MRELFAITHFIYGIASFVDPIRLSSDLTIKMYCKNFTKKKKNRKRYYDELNCEDVKKKKVYNMFYLCWLFLTVNH